MRKTHAGPMIRYQSLSMPIMVLSETKHTEEKDETIDVECDESNKTDKAHNNTNSDISPKEGRLYILCITNIYI